jgi:hypothetical protein
MTSARTLELTAKNSMIPGAADMTQPLLLPGW